jgi:hypothetical protein
MRLLRSASRFAGRSDPRTLSRSQGFLGRPVLRKAAWPMLGDDFALLAAVVVGLLGIGSEVMTEGQVLSPEFTVPDDEEVRCYRRLGGGGSSGALGRRLRRSRRDPAAARIGVSDGTDVGFTMPACRSMIGLAANPGTTVLPMCSISRTRWPGAARNRAISSWLGRATRGRKLRMRHARRGKVGPATSRPWIQSPYNNAVPRPR